MAGKDVVAMRIPTGRRAKWLKAFLDVDNPSTFLCRAGAARAAGYKASSKGSFSAIGSENLKILKPRVEKWLDEAGMSEAHLKIKLLQGLEASQIKFFAYQGRVVTEKEVIDWPTRLGFLKLAMQARGMLKQMHELTGKSGGPIKTENEHFTRFPAGPMTIEQWERECEEADRVRAVRDAEKDSDTD